MTDSYASPLDAAPAPRDRRARWGRLYGSAAGLAIVSAAERHDSLVAVLVADTPAATRMEEEIRFYASGARELPVFTFPDWETLPYDVFSPHQDIISDRLATLNRLPQTGRGIIICPLPTLMQRVSPPEYVEGSTLLLDVGDTLDLDRLRERLERSGYRYVSQVMEHGEFTVRGSLVDLFPMGSTAPYRIELFDDEVESIRIFDPETQRSDNRVDSVRLLPAREFPLTEEAIKRFRQAYREAFEGDPQRSPIYREVSNGSAPAGVEYYLPLFFEHTAMLSDYLPDSTLLLASEGMHEAAEEFWHEVAHRYEQGRHNLERPLLPPSRMFVEVNELFGTLKRFARADLQHFEEHDAGAVNFATEAPVHLTLDVRAERPTAALVSFLNGFDGRVLFAAESAGRREALLETLRGCDVHPTTFDNWHTFLAAQDRIGVVVAPLEHGLLMQSPRLAVIAEPQLYGEKVLQRRRRQRSKARDADAVIRNLAELQPGAPVVHEDHGVGRYLGLQRLTVGDMESEFLVLEYAGGDKLYVPVSSLELISRYTGVAPEKTPLHRLGSGQWEKARRKASEKVRDVAAELLAIYAQRAARKGNAYPLDDHAYSAFASSFPFEETPDQQEAIDAVLADMKSEQPMDRLVCGDVGFGKTEVAMRAAFVAVMGGKQVAILVPTTLLAQQHFENFRDRFADWPVRIEALSRFRSRKEQEKVLKDLESGSVDIIIGTHKLLQEGVGYSRLGLVIIDEEHRFGVRQKDRFKALRSEVDVLTLTATPIPRTLNMAVAGMRDISIIATAPAKRLAVKTFVTEWNNDLVREACLREIRRGGQVYFLHNDVQTIHTAARELEELVPESNVQVAHGQMPERELERVMSDFYHQRFNILVCTTIIETGIDIPSANTIVISRADRFGLAQLYQLRGRVGRSHHRAYAYLVVPSRRAMTDDARKRLEAIESIEELGTGFTLATHDLEIRGAGELLGEEQSGQMQEIGFTLYTEMLERAVEALKAGRQPETERPIDHGAEVDLQIPALIPDDYLPDVHSRLIMYKRIASAADSEELRELQVEMIDRFGLLPDQVKNLFRLTELKLQAKPLGIRKVELGAAGGRITFTDQPSFDPMRLIELVQKESRRYGLDPKQRLRITTELPDADSRFEMLERLLQRLAG